MNQNSDPLDFEWANLSREIVTDDRPRVSVTIDPSWTPEQTRRVRSAFENDIATLGEEPITLVENPVTGG